MSLGGIHEMPLLLLRGEWYVCLKKIVKVCMRVICFVYVRSWLGLQLVEAKQRSQRSVIGCVTKIHYVELLRALEATLIRIPGCICSR
jgi:hypothetical protein